MIAFVRELKLGEGVRGYKLEVQHDPEREREIYDAGVKLESSIQEAGTIACKVFMRLSSFPKRQAAAAAG